MAKADSEWVIGIAGLGLMGSALADTLMAQGFELRVWNRSPDKCARFADAGIGVGDTVKSIASDCDLLVVCLTDHAASMQVLQSASVAQRLAGKTLVLLSTMSADESSTTAAWAEENGIHYLDGAILGYPNNVRDKACMIVYSGPRAVFEACESVLEAMGGMPRLVGDRAGVAACFDKAIYSTYYAHTLGLIHGAAMCEAAGAPLEIFIEATTGYWEWSSEDAYLLNRIIKRDYTEQEAPLDLHAAAYAMIPPLCERLGVNAELPRAISEVFETALSRGHGGSDLPALFKVLGKADR
jgi:3-hydroxyisobutyrate dehydrogenase-like beta-hydroxyacid dehydrogenase